MLQAFMLILGVGLVVAGLYFAIGGFGLEESGGGYRAFKIEGPAWLVLVAVGVGVVILGLFEPWEEPSALTPPQNQTQDTDGDGLSDADEISLGADPSNPDSDADGLLDGDEVNTGTDPSNPDSDGDGFPDGDEVAQGTDPLDAASHP